MTPDEVAQLIRTARSGAGERATRCPQEEHVAAYVDAALAPAARVSLEEHFADCNACLALVGFLSRERGASPAEAVPEDLLARAQRLVPPKAGPRIPSAPQWAAAAGIVLAFSVLMLSSQHGPPSVEETRTAAARTTRAVSPTARTIEVLYPRAGAVVDRTRPVFRWTVVAGSPFYDVRVVTDAGELVAEQRVLGTEWRPDQQLTLQPGGAYYVHVDAFPSGSTAVGSEHVPFSVAD